MAWLRLAEVGDFSKLNRFLLSWQLDPLQLQGIPGLLAGFNARSGRPAFPPGLASPPRVRWSQASSLEAASAPLSAGAPPPGTRCSSRLASSPDARSLLCSAATFCTPVLFGSFSGPPDFGRALPSVFLPPAMSPLCRFAPFACYGVEGVSRQCALLVRLSFRAGVAGVRGSLLVGKP